MDHTETYILQHIIRPRVSHTSTNYPHNYRCARGRESMRIPPMVSENTLERHARFLFVLFEGKKKTKRKRERFFDLEFFEKRFSDPREKNGVYFRRVSPNISRHPSDDLVRRFSPHGSEAARDTETLLLSFFRPNIDFFPSIDPFALIYLIFVFLSLSFRPLLPPITRAVVNPFAQSNRK